MACVSARVSRPEPEPEEDRRWRVVRFWVRVGVRESRRARRSRSGIGQLKLRKTATCGTRACHSAGALVASATVPHPALAVPCLWQGAACAQ